MRKYYLDIHMEVIMQNLYHGAAFYPELWDEEIIEQDIKLMKETGINVARIGEFAWAKMEPEEDSIDISFFKNIIERLYENGIYSVMCTPTVTPPIWMTHGHPERMYKNADGVVMGHGSRQHACTNNYYYRERCRIIIEHISKEVGQLPGLIGWQIDNEFKSHTSECMCDTCKKEWHIWLENRYKTIDNLNEAWGTQIWSERYNSFDQVPQPGPVPFIHNSSLSTMYRLFSMEKLSEFANEQAQAIRKYSKAPITHNGSFGFMIDNESLYKNLDFASYDTYANYKNYSAYISNCDYFRNVKSGKKFWIMETSPYCGGSLIGTGSPHPKGYLKAEAVSAYALGGEAFCYWLWRQHKSGCEQMHGSVISAWGKPTVGYSEVLEVEKARKEIEDIILTTELCQPEVAMTYSDRAKAFLMTEPHKGLNYRGLTGDFHRRLLSMGIHRDMLPEGNDLEGYKLLFTPFVHYISTEFLSKITAFVKQGGIWIAGPLTGGRTKEHTIHTDAALGAIEKLAGVETVYTYPIDNTGAVGEAFGVEAPLAMWSSVFKPIDAKAVGIIKGGISPGLAFITEQQVGKGKVVMLGSMPAGESGNELMKKLIDNYIQEAKIVHRYDVTEGTLVVPRVGADFKIWIIINMDGRGGSVILPEEGRDLITGEKVGKGSLEVSKYQYRIIRF